MKQTNYGLLMLLAALLLTGCQQQKDQEPENREQTKFLQETVPVFQEQPQLPEFELPSVEPIEEVKKEENDILSDVLRIRNRWKQVDDSTKPNLTNKEN